MSNSSSRVPFDVDAHDPHTAEPLAVAPAPLQELSLDDLDVVHGGKGLWGFLTGILPPVQVNTQTGNGTQTNTQGPDANGGQVNTQTGDGNQTNTQGSVQDNGDGQGSDDNGGNDDNGGDDDNGGNDDNGGDSGGDDGGGDAGGGDDGGGDAGGGDDGGGE